MSTKAKVTLILIVFLAGFLRFYQMSVNPPGANSDEAAIGYNAYSILKTGRDEYGQFLPLAFRSFDDYKPPLYIYLTVPSVAVFGLNVFAVRFPSAFLGTITVAIVYFLVMELLKGKNHVRLLALAASFLLAISPWHLQFTRSAYETGSTVFFTSLGLLLFLKGLKKNRYLVLAGVTFALEAYLYQASKLFIPLFVGTLILLFWQEWVKHRRQLAMFACAFGAVFLPVVILTMTSTGLLRLKGTSILQDPKPHIRELSYRITDWLRNDNRSARLFHPDFTTYFPEIWIGYLSHLNLDFLFSNRHGPKVTFVPNVGLMQLWELPILITGFYYLVRKAGKRVTLLLLAWILLAPLPASFTTPTPSSIRTATTLPSLQIISAFGLVQLAIVLRTKIKQAHFLLGVLFILIAIHSYFFAYYWHMLLIHAPILYSRQWYYSYKDVVLGSAAIAKKYDRIVVSTNLDEPQIFYLFFLRYDPAKYLSSGGTVSGGFAEDRNRLEKFEFHSFDWKVIDKIPNVLMVGVPQSFPSDVKVLQKFHYLDGEDSIYFVESRGS